MNISLNLGGVIGAVLLMAVVIVLAVALGPDNIGSRVGGWGVPAVFLGAFGGNYLWNCLFAKSK